MSSEEPSAHMAAQGTKRKLIRRSSSKSKDGNSAAETTDTEVDGGKELNEEEIDRRIEAEERDEVEDADKSEDLDFIISDEEKDDNYSPPPSPHRLIPAPFLDSSNVMGIGRPEDLRKLVLDEHNRHKVLDNKWTQYQLLYLGGEPIFTPLTTSSAADRLLYYKSLQNNMELKAKHEERLEELEDEADMREKGYSEEAIRGNSEELTTSTKGYTLVHPVTEERAIGIAFGTTEILEIILSKLPAREVLRFEQVTWLTTRLIKGSRKLQVKVFFQALYPALKFELPHHTKDSSGTIQSKKRLLARKLNNIPPKIKLGGRGKHGGDLLGQSTAPPSSDDEVVVTVNPLFFNTKGKLLRNVLLTTETIDAGERYVLQFRTQTPLGDYLRPTAKTSFKNALITDPPLQYLTAFITGFSATTPNHGKRSKKSASPEASDEEAGDQGEEQAPVQKGKGKGKGKAKADTTDEIVPGTKKTAFASSVQIMAEEGLTLSAVLAKALDCVVKWEKDGARAGQEIVYDLYFPVGVKVVNDSF